jgi:hypothetical protein
VPGRSSAMTDWREGLLAFVIILGTWTALLSETLGIFKALDRRNLAIAWGIFALVILGWIWRRRGALGRGLVPRPRWRELGTLFVAIAAVYALILLVVALASPPNSIDSIQYHMSRAAHWAQQGSLNNFATPVERQLYMPPFAEIAILNVYLLAGSDHLVNLVQWSSMVVTLIAISLLSARLHASPKGQGMAVLFAATLPMGILQASGTLNDYVTALWVVCLANFAVKAHMTELTRREWALAGLATGIGVLTKATFVAFALPFLVWLGISTLRRVGWGQAIRFGLLGLLLVAILNAGAWRRNLRSFDTPLGPSWAVAAHANELWSWKVVVSNVVRGATLNLATPYGIVNGPMREAVVAFHTWIGLDANDPRTTFGEYRVKRAVNEQHAGYPYHYLLIPVCLLLLVWRRAPKADKGDLQATGAERGSAALAYAAAALAGYLLFCALYKWQLGGNRLHLPFYVAWAPAAGLALQRMRALPIHPRLRQAALPAIGLLLVVTSIRPLLINPARPVIPRAPDGITIWNTSRPELLFMGAPEVESAYFRLIDAARQSGCTSFGLAIVTQTPEYPLWALLAPPGSGVHLQHVDISAPLRREATEGPICAVLCTCCTERGPDGMDLTFSTGDGFNLYTFPSDTP